MYVKLYYHNFFSYNRKESEVSNKIPVSHIYFKIQLTSFSCYHTFPHVTCILAPN